MNQPVVIGRAKEARKSLFPDALLDHSAQTAAGSSALAVGASPQGTLSRARQAVLSLLDAAPSPVLRRALEADMVFAKRFRPIDVTRATKALVRRSARTVFRTDLDGQHVYSLNRRPTANELACLREACARRDAILTNDLLRRAGERYVRAVLRASRQYTNVTQASRLGSVVTRVGTDALDLVATHKKTGRHFGISVKNQREWLHAGSMAIKDCFKKATMHGRHPWLVVPFATAEAAKRCERDGIRLTILGRQIVPAYVKGHGRGAEIVASLRDVLGPQPYEYLRTRFDRTRRASASARLDVARVSA